MRYLDHRARRAGGNDNGDIAARVEVDRMMDMLAEDEMEALHQSDSDTEDGMNIPE